MRRKSHMRPNATYVSRITYQCDVRAIFNFSNLRTYVRYVKCKMRRMCESRGPTYVSLILNRNICSICVSYLKRDVSTIVTISHLSAILSFCIYVASIFNATYMHLKKSHLYAIRRTTRHMTHLKKRICKKCDVRRILNCDVSYTQVALNFSMRLVGCCVSLLRSAVRTTRGG